MSTQQFTIEELPDCVSPANPMHPANLHHHLNHHVLVCPFWHERNEMMPCRKISCLDCGGHISLHAENAPYISRGMTPVCVRCFGRRVFTAMKAEAVLRGRPSPRQGELGDEIDEGSAVPVSGAQS